MVSYEHSLSSRGIFERELKGTRALFLNILIVEIVKVLGENWGNLKKNGENGDFEQYPRYDTEITTYNLGR